jgi:hypothetical protein
MQFEHLQLDCWGFESGNAIRRDVLMIEGRLKPDSQDQHVSGSTPIKSLSPHILPSTFHQDDHNKHQHLRGCEAANRHGAG